MTTPPPTQFRTQAELIDYLGAMERRVATLEQENQQQQQAIDGLFRQPVAPVPAPVVAPAVAPSLPKTDLLSKNFLTRAFSVWGHAFVASLIIAVGLGVIAVIVYLVIFALSAANA
jgi:hypothetical protein